MSSDTPRRILPVIVLAQFTGTSLWFAGNAVVPDLIAELQLLEAFIGFITMAVQAGFIVGTLIFAALSIADRFSPVKVFLFCSIAGAAANLLTIWSDTFTEVMLARVFTGFFLAGIYPVGMKIASDWHKQGLGKALGYLVGALVLGTAFPHLLKFLGGDLPWRFVFISTSGISLGGGLLLFLSVPDGPFKGRPGAFRPSVMMSLFRDRNFRSAAFGYFGHMWELYTFWAFVPVMLSYLNSIYPGVNIDVSLFSFLIVGIGGISCAIGGHLSASFSSRKVALYSIALSGMCCLLIPAAAFTPLAVGLILLFVWGIAVIPDSPQFSTLVARSSDPSYVATGLTIVNCIGFSLTIFSIQLINFSWIAYGSLMVFWLILPGPVLGFLSVRRYKDALPDSQAPGRV